MARVVPMISVSLDGFIEGPTREIDWHVVDDELHWHFNDELRHAGAFLDGRAAWELMARFWPTADAARAAPASVVDFARIWRGTPKIVYSRTLQRAGWNTTIAREVVPGRSPRSRRRCPAICFWAGPIWPRRSCATGSSTSSGSTCTRS